ncbi:hypothetical protein JB92DRAFT_3093489 [Gautieria morchelliformis]|nr:hypothetical protein JB92DRAFT_3093489 [Gautieria morchelliformis]
MTRIYAVYERNRRLLVLFGMLFVAEIAGSLAVVDTGFPRSIPRPSGISTGCYFSAQPPLYFLAWIPEIIGESILCLLMLYKAWTMYTNSQSSSLLRLIIRDRYEAILNQVCSMFAILLINCLVSAFAPVNYQEVAIRNCPESLGLHGNREFQGSGAIWAICGIGLRLCILCIGTTVIEFPVDDVLAQLQPLTPQVTSYGIWVVL